MHLDIGTYRVTTPLLLYGRFLGTCTDVVVEDLQINGKLQLEMLFNQNIPFPHLAAVTICFTEE